MINFILLATRQYSDRDYYIGTIIIIAFIIFCIWGIRRFILWRRVRAIRRAEERYDRIQQRRYERRQRRLERRDER